MCNLFLIPSQSLCSFTFQFFQSFSILFSGKKQASRITSYLVFIFSLSYSWFFTINTLINQFVLSKETSFFWVAFLWIVLYLFLAAKYFYAETYWRSLYKSLLVFAINFLLILPFAFVLILVSSFLFY